MEGIALLHPVRRFPDAERPSGGRCPTRSVGQRNRVVRQGFGVAARAGALPVSNVHVETSLGGNGEMQRIDRSFPPLVDWVREGKVVARKQMNQSYFDVHFAHPLADARAGSFSEGEERCLADGFRVVEAIREEKVRMGEEFLVPLKSVDGNQDEGSFLDDGLRAGDQVVFGANPVKICEGGKFAHGFVYAMVQVFHGHYTVISDESIMFLERFINFLLKPALDFLIVDYFIQAECRS